jgi:hypothetical protein
MLQVMWVGCAVVIVVASLRARHSKRAARAGAAGGGRAAVGVLVLAGGRRTQLGLAAAIAFHVALLAFGWGVYLWSIPIIGALNLLLRAERRADRRPAAVVMPHAVAA